MATTSNLYIDQGSDYQVTVTVNDQSLVGHTAAAQFRKSYGSSTAYNFVCTVNEGDDDVDGTVTLTLLGVDSDDIPAGRYLYDVEVTSPGGTKTRIVEGLVILNPQITKPVDP